MDKKGLIISLIICAITANMPLCYGQTETKDVYKSLFFSYSKQDFFNCVDLTSEKQYDNLKSGFNFELGYSYIFRIHKKLYFETGVTLGSISDKGPVVDSWNSKIEYDASFSNIYVQVPVCLDLMLPLNDKIVIYPSLGLDLGLVSYSSEMKVTKNESYGSYSISKDDVEDEDNSGISLNAVAPQIGINVIIDRLMLGLKYESFWGGTFTQSVNYLFTAGFTF